MMVANNRRGSLFAATGVMVLSFLMAGLSLYKVFSVGWIHWIGVATCFIGVGLAWYTRSLIFQNRNGRAGWILIVWTIISVFLVKLLSPGDSWILGIVVALVATLIACETLKGFSATWGVFIGIAGGSLIISLDTFLLKQADYQLAINPTVLVIGVIGMTVGILMVSRVPGSSGGCENPTRVIRGWGVMISISLVFVSKLMLEILIQKGAIVLNDPWAGTVIQQMMVNVGSLLVVGVSIYGIILTQYIFNPLRMVNNVLDQIAAQGGYFTKSYHHSSG